MLLSLDGIRYDYPERIGGGGFGRLNREGVKGERLEPPFPASTFPSHATLATGCYPERHGILSNRFRDARRGDFDRSEDPDWIDCEPLWVTAERQGVRAAVSAWIGSYGPWRGTEATYHDGTFPRRANGESVRRILAWLRLPAAERPRLILAYLPGLDHAGHDHGPDSTQVRDGLRAVDRLLERLLQGLESTPDKDRVVLIVVSDHGMARQDRTVDPVALLRRRGIRNRAFLSGGSANIYLSRTSDRERAAAVLSSAPGLEIFSGESLPVDLHYRFPGRTGDLVLVAPVGAGLVPDQDSGGIRQRGIHGYRGTEDTMGGIFYAWGAGIRRGQETARVRAVDIYSLTCELLGMRPSPRAQGRVPPGVLTPR